VNCGGKQAWLLSNSIQSTHSCIQPYLTEHILGAGSVLGTEETPMGQTEKIDFTGVLNLYSTLIV
jgi:hypothetical protein